MKKFLLVVLFSIIMLPAFSDAVWQEIQSKDRSLYIDTSSITNQDSQYLYWIKTNTVNGYKKMLMKSDCSNNTTGVQKIIVYDNNDKVIKSENVKQELSYVVPDSDAQAAYNYVCNIYKTKQSVDIKKQNAVTPNKIFRMINSVNNAGYEVQSIKNNTLNVIKGF
ncbi:hypothetical protein IJI31_06975 [bacterium]|nr:hypothetical protein [bacterium]